MSRHSSCEVNLVSSHPSFELNCIFRGHSGWVLMVILSEVMSLRRVEITRESHAVASSLTTIFLWQSTFIVSKMICIKLFSIFLQFVESFLCIAASLRFSYRHLARFVSQIASEHHFFVMLWHTSVELWVLLPWQIVSDSWLSDWKHCISFSNISEFILVWLVGIFCGYCSHIWVIFLGQSPISLLDLLRSCSCVQTKDGIVIFF